ncbi:GH92 family glycosyl hydrolase [Flavobacteriaceae bacterium]|nr:GH92 family glycosyl hydrolase [Flavobacteriaceae bacterium]
MNNLLKIYTITALFILSCTKEKQIKEQQLTSLVNPFVGTGGHGHTFPGASMPFGMMQLSPDTRLDGWDGCSGYHYSDSYIYGFTHTHLSGTGILDYGDILLMPTNQINFNNGSDGNNGYRSSFSHQNETASPGYYSVHLDDTDIDVTLTVSERSGIHHYKFPPNSDQVIILDLTHRDQVIDSNLNLVDSSHLSGYRFSSSWAKDQRVFYDMFFSRPYSKVIIEDDVLNGKSVRAAFVFDSAASNELEVRVGISAVDELGALKNRTNELDNKTFEEIRQIADSTWEKQLNKIVVETFNEEDKYNFYTSLYHTMLAPNLYQDIDGRYRGMDMKIHQDKALTYYTVFSLWDTFRAAHPLYTIIEEDRTNNFIRTFLNKYEEGGIMPIWDLSANYTNTMIGYHAVSVIADAYLKGIRDYDAAKAFEAMKHSANQDHFGLGIYKDYGFVPVEYESESVSKTLEYAYDDWAIATMGKSLGQLEDYKTFLQRAQYYKNVIDPETNFMRGRFNNKWYDPFDPYEVNFNYTEANSWHYTYFVPHDISGHISIVGGKKKYENMLDNLFSASTATTGRNQSDITGLIGQYAHGNEPSHHMAYLYNFINKPYKTQEKIRQILDEQYSNKPNGISGNEDCGQMSAWYVFSALGFYPVTPGSGDYVIGSPIVKSAAINLENGNTFTISAPNNNSQKKYIKGAKLNNGQLLKTFITHEDIVNGGKLDFNMSEEISDWGTQDSNIPSTEINEFLITTPPYIASGELAFFNETNIELKSIQPEAKIYYSTGTGFYEYTKAITIYADTILKTYAEINGVNSATIETTLRKKNPNIKIKLNTEYYYQYSAGGDDALVDGVIGGEDFRTGAWQGYLDQDVDALVNLSNSKLVKNITVNFLSDQGAWIFFPNSVECYISADGKNFKRIGIHNFEIQDKKNPEIKTITFSSNNESIQYVKIIANKIGPVPEWHIGSQYDGKGWIFVDEIQINYE